MANFDFTITDADMGRSLGVPDGYLVTLIRTKATTAGTNEMPQFSEATQNWKAGYFVLRGSRDNRNLFAIAPSDSLPSHVWARGASIGYRGELKVICVPRGSEWSVTLSDVPVPRPPYVNRDVSGLAAHS
jgi:hypothetical protein